MANKFSQLLTLAGFGLVAASNCLYLVDPGEKALIMNNLTGLQKRVFHQGYHLRIPFIEVDPRASRPPSSTMPASDPSTSMSPPVPKIYKPSLSPFESCNSQSLKNCQKFTSCSERTTKRRCSTRSDKKSSAPSSPSVPFSLPRRC